MTANNRELPFFATFAAIFLIIALPLYAQTKKLSPEAVSGAEEEVSNQSKPLIKISHSSESPGSPVEPASNEPESDRIFRRDLILQINEIIQKIQKEYPVLSRELDSAKQKEILKSVVSALNRGMKYVAAGDPEKKVSTPPNIEVEPAIMLASNKILYIRVGSFSKDNLVQLKKDCDNCAEFEKQNIGIIIDLRNSQGYDYNSAIHATALFATEKEMTEHNLKSPLKQVLTQPIIILTGTKTKGASEIFTRVLVEMKRAISLGERTAGVPFKKRKVTLANGDWLLIPQVPETLAEILPIPIKPSIKFTPYPQIKYEILKKTPDAEDGDKCIQRAVELILCLDALKHE